MIRKTGVQSQVKSYHQRLKKWHLMHTCLTLSIIRYGARVKGSNLGYEGVVPPTPRISSYGKGSLRVALYYGRWLYFYFLLVMRGATVRSNMNKMYCFAFFCRWLSTVFQNTNDFSTDFFYPLVESNEVLPLRIRVDLGVMAMISKTALSQSDAEFVFRAQ